MYGQSTDTKKILGSQDTEHKTQNEDKQSKKEERQRPHQKHNTENKKEERQRPHQKIWGELER